jgi:hypothetical protein
MKGDRDSLVESLSLYMNGGLVKFKIIGGAATVSAGAENELKTAK